MNSNISDKDKKDWEDFLLNNESLPDKDKRSFKKKDIVKTFDLHGFSLDEANEKIKNLIFDAYDEGVKKLIIVTGKGLHSQNENDPYISKKFGILKATKKTSAKASAPINLAKTISLNRPAIRLNPV